MKVKSERLERYCNSLGKNGEYLIRSATMGRERMEWTGNIKISRILELIGFNMSEKAVKDMCKQ
jgi:hypothetical protein